MGVIAYGMERGIDKNGLPWLCGDVSIGKKYIHVDTRTGEGVEEILNGLKRFIFYQASKVKFPSMGADDAAQEIRLLAIEAIPRYADDKNANMLTFLQGHIKNRLINRCKYFSEKKRRATYCNLPSYKVRCPSCKKFVCVDTPGKVECVKCGVNTDGIDKWKRYNMPIMPIPFSALDSKLSDDSSSICDLIPNGQNFAMFAGKTHYEVDEQVQFRLDFQKIYESMDNTNKTIVSMLLEGYAYRDIANKIGISEKATYARVAKILQSSKYERGII